MMSAATVTEGGYVQLSYFFALNQFLFKKKKAYLLLRYCCQMFNNLR